MYLAQSRAKPVEQFGDIASRSYDRGHDPKGSSRQLGAIIADRASGPQLAKLRMPVTVIHGTDDKLVRKSGGRSTARAIPGAKLVEIKGMGHGLPRGAWPQIIDAIVANAERATPAARSAARSGSAAPSPRR